MYKNYINSQKILNKKDSIMFLKTHSCFVNTNKFKFTDRHNTLGVIYIVRDPRNIIPSHSQDFKITEDQSLKFFLSQTVSWKRLLKDIVLLIWVHGKVIIILGKFLEDLINIY